VVHVIVLLKYFIDGPLWGVNAIFDIDVKVQCWWGRWTETCCDQSNIPFTGSNSPTHSMLVCISLDGHG